MTTIINNIDKLKTFFKFEEGYYYKFALLVRHKDNLSPLKIKLGKELLVKDWLIDTEERLNNLIPDMVFLTKTVGGRLYVTADRKNALRTMEYMYDAAKDQIFQRLHNPTYQVSTKILTKFTSSASSVNYSSDRANKTWMFDIDSKDDILLQLVEKICGKYHLLTVETKNGYHVLAEKKFPASELLTQINTDLVQVKDNALVLAYMEY